MKIDISGQILCASREKLSSIAFVLIEEVTALKKRGNSCALTFFDKGKEKGNKKYIEEYLADVEIDLNEINDHSFKTYSDIWMGRNDDNPELKNYQDISGSGAEVFYFPSVFPIPYRLPEEKTIITVNDILPITDSVTRSFNNNLYIYISNVLKYLKERKDIMLTAISQYVKNELIDYGLEESRIQVVSLAYDKNKYYCENDLYILDKYGISNDYVLYLGRFEPRKGIDTIINAFSGIKNKKIKLVMAGNIQDEYKQTLYNLLKNCSNSQNIIFTGFVSDYEKRVLMSMAVAFVFPSYAEGFGLPVLEAMACGTPVITTNATSLPEVGGNAVLYIRPGDYNDLRETMELLLSDQNLRDEYIKRGYERCKLFSWEKTAEGLEEAFKKTIEGSIL